jgi:hypothetical protein
MKRNAYLIISALLVVAFVMWAFAHNFDKTSSKYGYGDSGGYGSVGYR